MKKIVAGQFVILLLTILLGVILKGDLESGIRTFHRAFGLLAVLAGVTVLANAFLRKQTLSVKILSVITLLLTLSAGMGGMSIRSGDDYNSAFNQMAISATAALVVSVVTYFKVKAEKIFRVKLLLPQFF